MFQDKVISKFWRIDMDTWIGGSQIQKKIKKNEQTMHGRVYIYLK